MSFFGNINSYLFRKSRSKDTSDTDDSCSSIKKFKEANAKGNYYIMYYLSFAYFISSSK